MITTTQRWQVSQSLRHRKRIMLVDDHAVVRRGLATLINEAADLEVCGEADSERSAIENIAGMRPDVAVVDWSLGYREAGELIQTMREGYPELPILVLSIHDEVFYAERVLRAGASGYLMKQEATERILDAIRRVSVGEVYLSDRALEAVHPNARSGDRRKERDADCTWRPAGHAVIPRLSVVVPVFNSESTIERLGEGLIREIGKAFRLQLILVDDGSVDQSAEACRRLQARYPESVDFVELSRNFGEHNAVMAGLNCVDGEYCVIMDDDLQNPPEEIWRLVQEMKNGHDVVYARYPRKCHSMVRNIGSWLHNQMATLALGKPRDLYLSSFKILSRFLVREVVRYTGPDPYLDAIILRTTRRIGVITVNHAPRRQGRSGYTMAKLLGLWGNMVIAFSLYPVRICNLYGIVMMSVGLVYGVHTAIAYLSPQLPDPDPIRQYDASNWFLRGVTIMAISLVAEYVGRIHMSINRAPQFIVRDRVSSGPSRRTA